MTGLLRKILVAGFMFALSAGTALADQYLQPFVLAYTSSSDVPTVAAEVKSKLTAGGYQVVGEYSPYDGADIIVVTNDALKAEAAKTDFGAYGAMIRVSVTRDGVFERRRVGLPLPGGPLEGVKLRIRLRVETVMLWIRR